MVEKLKAIYYILIGKEYAVFVITQKEGKIIRKRSTCTISNNTSYKFMLTIHEFSKKYLESGYCK